MFNRMKLYTVHIKPGMDAAGEKPVFVREGFNAWAFIFTLFWALYQRLWIPALLIIAFNVVLVCCVKAYFLNHQGMGIVDLGFHFLVGYQGNDWLRSRLTQRGYVLADISAGDSLLRAEQRYFERYLAHA